MEYSLLADALNKFSQLTPWVQVAICLGLYAMVLGVAYFVKEIVTVVVSPFKRAKEPKEQKKEWRDKYYHGGEAP